MKRVSFSLGSECLQVALIVKFSLNLSLMSLVEQGVHTSQHQHVARTLHRLRPFSGHRSVHMPNSNMSISVTLPPYRHIGISLPEPCVRFGPSGILFPFFGSFNSIRSLLSPSNQLYTVFFLERPTNCIHFKNSTPSVPPIHGG